MGRFRNLPAISIRRDPECRSWSLTPCRGREGVIEIETQLPVAAKQIEVGESGRIVAAQLLKFDRETSRAHVVQVGVPALGYKTYYVRAAVRFLRPKLAVKMCI